MWLGRVAFWVSVSLVLHAMLFGLLGLREHEPPAMPVADLWMEAATPQVLPPAPEPPAPEPPPTPRKARPAPVQRAEREPTPEESKAPPVPAAPELTAPVVDGESSVAVKAGDGESAIGSTGGLGDGKGTASAGGGASHEDERKAGPAQLSLWLEMSSMERLALSRPTIALLMAVPGYSEILRGSGIRPLVDLKRVRVRLWGLAPERLLIAGVHNDGAAAVVGAAERIAAMRDRAPEWRGDDDFRATSWVDGSEADRGLALHGGAFVIAPRKTLPEVLGAKATEERVQAASRLKDRVLALITIEDAPRYLPKVDACALQAVRISFADGGGSPRLTLVAHYKSASLASEAGACLRGLEAELGAQMPLLSSWLSRAQLTAGGSSAQLTLGVNSNDIEKLFGELAWALRSARRA
jgi:hypothetical protein